MMSDRHFQGNGIRLRAPEPEDLEVMFRFENATDVWEMSNTTGPYSRFQLKQYIWLCWKNTVSVIWEFISCLPISLWKTFLPADSLRRAGTKRVRY